MKILESTERRLAIEFDNSVGESVWLALWINILVSVCFVVIRKTLPAIGFYFSILYCTLGGWLLVHLLYPGNKKNAYYWETVIMGSIPMFGVGCSSLSAITLLQFPQTAALTFDKDENFLFVTKTFNLLFWRPIAKYPLDEIIGFTLAAKTVYAPGNHIIPVSVIQLARRRHNGKILQKDLVGRGDANQSLVDRMNRFLHLH